MSEHASTPSTAARILVVDDEPQIRRFLEISLRAQGYRVALADSAQAGLDRLATDGADLVILDLGLPDRDGQAVLADLRQWSQVPVIVLTVRGGETEKVAALDAGANDYVTKPFGVQELMARVRGLLRTHALPEGSAPPVYDDGRLRVDLARREVALEGATVTLSRKEYALLALLVQHAGRVVTQPQLLREVWGPTHQEDTHYLRILVAKLRQKLGDDAASPRWIATEPGVGLRFLVNQ
jgi:two-component system, OmpR family, KDP operon response regulator KdpE